MTRERAKELLPVIKAFAEGKIIQILGNNGQWFDLKDFPGLNATFDSENCEFRLKPEPREFWLRMCTCPEHCVAIPFGKKPIESCCFCSIHHVREV